MFRSRVACRWLLASLPLVGCAPPECLENEVRIGTVCRSRKASDEDASREEASATADDKDDAGTPASNTPDSGTPAAHGIDRDASEERADHGGGPSDAGHSEPPKTTDLCAQAGCDANATCSLKDGGATCQCDPGYTLSRSGKGCDDIDECTVSPKFCAGGKVCTNTLGGAECSCPARTYGANAVADPSFESQGTTLGAPWLSGSTVASSPQYTVVAGRVGAKAMRALQSSGWVDIWQPLTLKTNTPHRMTVQYRTSASAHASYFGIRLPNNAAVADSGPVASVDWTQKSIDFTTGADADIVVFLGVWATNGDTWIEIDDISIQEVTSAACM